MRFPTSSLLALTLGALSVLPTAMAATARIMALGDSITGSPGCWRAYLDRSLVADGYTDKDFVGSLDGQSCGHPLFDSEHEGHGGFLATNIANANQLVGWLDNAKPNIVIVHLGTNDVWSNISPAVITTAFSKLVDQMRDSNPNMQILWAQILPMHPTNCDDCNNRVIALNSAITTWAAGKSTSASPITVVDQYTGFDTSVDTYDGVHPGDAGNIKIAARWLEPLKSAIRVVNGGSAPAPTTTSASTRPTTTVLPPTTTVVPPTTTSAAPTPTATAGVWQQCGGINHTGPTVCGSGLKCVKLNDYYFQCQP